MGISEEDLIEVMEAAPETSREWGLDLSGGAPAVALACDCECHVPLGSKRAYKGVVRCVHCTMLDGKGI